MTPEANRLEEMKRRFGAGHFADVPGARLHYARMGEKGPPLILLHGWPEFWLTWYRNMPALAERYRVFAPDIRGFGESRSHDRPAHAALTPDIIAADLVALMDALEIERAGFVAHDVGANAMQCFARLYPERVAALFFFNCPTHGVGARWRAAFRRFGIRLSTSSASLKRWSATTAIPLPSISAGSSRTGRTTRPASRKMSNSGLRISVRPAPWRAASPGTRASTRHDDR